jgi:hypothetical protein
LETIDVETWEDFEKKIEELKPPKAGGFLYRGQGNACWSLETTLERSGQKGILFSKYYRTISVIRSQIESFTTQDWGELPDVMTMRETFQEYDAGSLALDGIGATTPFPATYSYMAYLRHHGFPSPLLDWTRSPYVAAYFAFRRSEDRRVAIYVYSERPDNMKSSSSDQPQIKLFGPYVKTHARHFLQQSAYTICVQFLPTGWQFSSHETVFSCAPPFSSCSQDLLWKFILPATERVKVLEALDRYNLNAFSLFDSEEALMETLAFRHIGLKNSVVQPDANALNKTTA